MGVDQCKIAVYKTTDKWRIEVFKDQQGPDYEYYVEIQLRGRAPRIDTFNLTRIGFTEHDKFLQSTQNLEMCLS